MLKFKSINTYAASHYLIRIVIHMYVYVLNHWNRALLYGYQWFGGLASLGWWSYFPISILILYHNEHDKSKFQLPIYHFRFYWKIISYIFLPIWQELFTWTQLKTKWIFMSSSVECPTPRQKHSIMQQNPFNNNNNNKDVKILKMDTNCSYEVIWVVALGAYAWALETPKWVNIFG